MSDEKVYIFITLDDKGLSWGIVPDPPVPGLDMTETWKNHRNVIAIYEAKRIV